MRGRNTLLGYWLATVVLAMAGTMIVLGCVAPSPPPPVEMVATPVPDPVPNLSAEEYAAMSGFDASTEQTLREQVRHNDLQWRVEKLEREVRRLNQRVYGIAELRIGDQPPPSPEETK